MGAAWGKREHLPRGLTCNLGDYVFNWEVTKKKDGKAIKRKYEVGGGGGHKKRGWFPNTLRLNCSCCLLSKIKGVEAVERKSNYKGEPWHIVSLKTSRRWWL